MLVMVILGGVYVQIHWRLGSLEKSPHESGLGYLLCSISCLLLWLKSWSARGASRHPTFMGNLPTISHTC